MEQDINVFGRSLEIPFEPAGVHVTIISVSIMTK